jgi:hypothetical protein
MNHKFTKEVDGQILYNGTKMELFVPDDFFKMNLAEEVGQSYYIFGSLRAFHYSNKNDDRSKAIQSTLCYPLKFYTIPDEVSQEEIDIGNGEQKYTVLTYYNNGVLFTNSEIIRNVDNLSYFVTMLTEGRLDIIEYSKMARMLQLCKYYNNVNFGTPAMYEEVIIADYYRDPDDPTRSARFAANETNKKHFYSRGITQREKVSFTSTFSGITFEDITSMITMADNAKRENRKETISDVEKVSLGLI